MILALIALYLVVAILGVIGAYLLPGSNAAVLLAGIVAALIAGVFWVVLALHSADVLHSLKGTDRTFAKNFRAAVRPTPAQLLISTAITLLAWLLAHALLDTPVACGLLSGLPLLALALAKVARFGKQLLKPAPSRTRWILIVACSALIAANLCLLTHWSAESPPALTVAWTVTTMLVVAMVLYIAASNYNMAIETGVIQPSRLLKSLAATLRSSQAHSPAPPTTKQNTYRGPAKGGKRTRRVR